MPVAPWFAQSVLKPFLRACMLGYLLPCSSKPEGMTLAGQVTQGVAWLALNIR